MDKKFYVYVYLDPRRPGEFVYGKYVFDHEPFYVGKGFDHRYKDHLYGKSVNMMKVNKIKKIKKMGKEPIIIKYQEELLE